MERFRESYSRRIAMNLMMIPWIEKSWCRFNDSSLSSRRCIWSYKKNETDTINGNSSSLSSQDLLADYLLQRL
ncbi:hypothetical protein HA466_0001550 [Hirschfeldia incana]|nr:hypothetical protein HA466_0001550 [Hirschfeldia incana]